MIDTEWLCVDKIHFNVWNSVKYSISLYYKNKNPYSATNVLLRMFGDLELLPAARTVCVMTTGIRTCPPIAPVLLIFYRVRDRDRKQKMMTKTKQLTYYLVTIFIEISKKKYLCNIFIHSIDKRMNWWWKSADVGRKQRGGRKGKTKDKHRRRESTLISRSSPP